MSRLGLPGPQKCPPDARRNKASDVDTLALEPIRNFQCVLKRARTIYTVREGETVLDHQRFPSGLGFRGPWARGYDFPSFLHHLCKIGNCSPQPFFDCYLRFPSQL